MPKNTQGKMRKGSPTVNELGNVVSSIPRYLTYLPYEVWQASTWTWYVLKKWQVDDSKPYARWFCLVTSPIVPEGEMGDVYVSEIKQNASLVWRESVRE